MRCMQCADKPHTRFYAKIISKNFKLNSFLIVKSELEFRTCFMVLSKVVEQIELYITLNFEMHIYGGYASRLIFVFRVIKMIDKNLKIPI